MSEHKELLEVKKPGKRVKKLPVPFDDTSMRILIGLQGDYQSKYRRKIHRADLAGIIIAKALKNASI